MGAAWVGLSSLVSGRTSTAALCTGRLHRSRTKMLVRQRLPTHCRRHPQRSWLCSTLCDLWGTSSGGRWRARTASAKLAVGDLRIDWALCRALLRHQRRAHPLAPSRPRSWSQAMGNHEQSSGCGLLMKRALAARGGRCPFCEIRGRKSCNRCPGRLDRGRSTIRARTMPRAYRALT